MSGTRRVLAVGVAALLSVFALPAEEPSDPSELLPNGRLLDDGLLVGGQPSLEQLDALSHFGYKTVISLRGPDEPAVPEGELVARGLVPVLLPILSPEDLDEPHALQLAEALENAEGPVVLHCGSGNRVGALLAMKAYWVDGRSAEEAIEVGRASGLTGLEEAVRSALERAETGGDR